MTERQFGVWLNPLWETIITGRRPVCSEPDLGTRSAQKTSPRFNAALIRSDQVVCRSDLQMRVKVPWASGVLRGESGNRFVARNLATMAEPKFNRDRKSVV